MGRVALAAVGSRPQVLRTAGGVPDQTESTLVSASYTVTADGVTTDAVTYTAENGAGAVMPNKTVTFTVERVFLSASLSTVDAAPGTIADNGVDTSTVEVQVKDTDGYNAPGIGFAQAVLAVTGTGNTVTQPAARTDAQGRTSGTLASTVAATKTASYTVSGLAITDTANIVVSGTPGVWPNEPAGFTAVADWNDEATLSAGGFTSDGTPFRSIDQSSGSLGAITTTTTTIVAAAGSWTAAGLTDPGTDPDNTPQYIKLANQDAGNNGRYCLVTALSGVTATVTPIDGSPLVANSTPDAAWQATAGWGEYSVVTSGYAGSPTIGGTSVMQRFYPAGVDGGHDAGRIIATLDDTKDEVFVGAEVQFANDSTTSTSLGGNKQIFIETNGGANRIFTNFSQTESWGVYIQSTALTPTYTASVVPTYGAWTTEEFYCAKPSGSDNDGVIQVYIGGTLAWEKDNCSVGGGTFPPGDFFDAYLDMSNNGNRYPTGADPRRIGVSGGAAASATAWCAALYVSQPT